MLRLYKKGNNDIPSTFLHLNPEAKVAECPDYDYRIGRANYTVSYRNKSDEYSLLYLLYFLIYLKPYVSQNKEYKEALDFLRNSLNIGEEAVKAIDEVMVVALNSGLPMAVNSRTRYGNKCFLRGVLYYGGFDSYPILIPVIDREFFDAKLRKSKKPSIAEFLRNTTFMVSGELPLVFMDKLKANTGRLIGVRGSGKVSGPHVRQTLRSLFTVPDITELMPDFYFPEKQKEIITAAFNSLSSTYGVNRMEESKPETVSTVGLVETVLEELESYVVTSNSNEVTWANGQTIAF